MRRILRPLFLAIVCSGTILLQSCLPDGSDPESAGSNKMGAYYASSLNAIAMQIQDIVLNDPTWVTATQGDSNLDLAALGVKQPQGLGAEIKSGACPVGDGESVKQVTWIDGRGDFDKFSLKQVGGDVKALMTSLRTHLGSDQIGIYRGGGQVALVNGSSTIIPQSCSTISIPLGAPVVVFSIEHPAQPRVRFSRDEYRTVSCAINESGTKIEKRTIVYNTDGTIYPTDASIGWSPEDMGGCIEKVVVAIKDRTDSASASSALLANFAAVNLRAVLEDQLKMGCTTLTVTKNGNNGRQVDTCGQANISGTDVLSSTQVGMNADTREIACSGTVADATAMFNTIPVSNAVMTWQVRPGFTNLITLVRDSGSNQMSNGQSGTTNNRDRWVGSAINCAAVETGSITCENLPGAPPLQQQSNQKFINGQLNPAYFTGATLTQNNGVSITRNLSSTTFVDHVALTPRIDSEPWNVTAAQCSWNVRDMYGNCPLNYDASKQGGWTANHEPGFRPQTSYDNPGSGSPYIKRWNTVNGNTNAYTTQLNQDGVIAVYTTTNQNGTVTVAPTGNYASPMLCGRDELRYHPWTLMIRTGPRNGVNGINGTTLTNAGRTTTLQENTYREWSGTSQSAGTWSAAKTLIKTTENGLSVPPGYQQANSWTSFANVPPWFEIDQTHACPALVNPTRQLDCDLRNPSIGPIHLYRSGGVGTDGCERQGYCHQETGEECMERAERGENATAWGCCQAYNYGCGSTPDSGYTGYN